MTGKFHVNSEGRVMPCNAQSGNCPFGGDDQHFDNFEEAQLAADKKNEVDEEKKMRRDILKDMDSLEYSAKDGFYDKELDMEFRYLEDWLKFKYGVSYARKLHGKVGQKSYLRKLLAKITE